MYAFLVAFGSMLIAIAGQIKVPMWPNPTVTLQTLAIFTIAAAYGRNLAVATLLAYIAEGAAGLPVFTNGGGLAYFAGPTGYLAGFVIAAGITGWAADRGWSRKPLKVSASPTFLARFVVLVLGARGSDSSSASRRSSPGASVRSSSPTSSRRFSPPRWFRRSGACSAASNRHDQQFEKPRHRPRLFYACGPA
jgi:hypothetical protein